MAAPNQNLQVMFDGNGCPTEVLSHDNSCGGGGDRPNEACRSNGAPVRWAPESEIGEIRTKAGSPGALHNCRAHANQGYYQCIVRGNVGDRIEYDVISSTGCPMDPVIIVR